MKNPGYVTAWGYSGYLPLGLGTPKVDLETVTSWTSFMYTPKNPNITQNTKNEEKKLQEIIRLKITQIRHIDGKV